MARLTKLTLLVLTPAFVVLFQGTHSWSGIPNYVDVILSARRLPSTDDGRISKRQAPEPFAVIYHAYGSGNLFSVVGVTDLLVEDSNPDWQRIFRVGFLGLKSEQIIKVVIFDADTNYERDYVGEVEFKLADVMKSFGRQMNVPLGKRKADGWIVVKGRVVSKGQDELEDDENKENIDPRFFRTDPENVIVYPPTYPRPLSSRPAPFSSNLRR